MRWIHYFLVLFMVLAAPALVSAQEVMVNGSFETPESTGWPVGPRFPSTYGDWGGDTSEIRSAENGITPFLGERMLRFNLRGFQPVSLQLVADDSAYRCDAFPRRHP